VAAAEDNGRTDANGLLEKISTRLIRALPPAFIMLALINLAFLGALVWIIDSNVDARNEMLGKIVDRCLLRADADAKSR
jgi:hypothetical protein